MVVGDGQDTERQKKVSGVIKPSDNSEFSLTPLPATP